MESGSHTPVAGTMSDTARGGETLASRFPAWVPWLGAGILLVLGMVEARQIATLKKELFTANIELNRLNRSHSLINLRVTALDARDPAYNSSRVMMAWDPYQFRGVLSVQNLPAPAAGSGYQLWVLDPEAEKPISAGMIRPADGTARFAVKPLTTPNPGFAITLEPAGGSPSPTTPVLFAVAPGS